MTDLDSKHSYVTPSLYSVKIELEHSIANGSLRVDNNVQEQWEDTDEQSQTVEDLWGVL